MKRTCTAFVLFVAACGGELAGSVDAEEQAVTSSTLTGVYLQTVLHTENASAAGFIASKTYLARYQSFDISSSDGAPFTVQFILKSGDRTSAGGARLTGLAIDGPWCTGGCSQAGSGPIPGVTVDVTNATLSLKSARLDLYYSGSGSHVQTLPLATGVDTLTATYADGSKRALAFQHHNSSETYTQVAGTFANVGYQEDVRELAARTTISKTLQNGEALVLRNRTAQIKSGDSRAITLCAPYTPGVVLTSLELRFTPTGATASQLLKKVAVPGYGGCVAAEVPRQNGELALKAFDSTGATIRSSYPLSYE